MNWSKITQRRLQVSSFLIAFSFLLCLFLQFKSLQRHWVHISPSAVHPNPGYTSLPRIPIEFTANTPRNVCAPVSDRKWTDDDQPTSFVIVVYTRPENFEVRQIVRETWGARDVLGPMDALVLFPIGRTLDANVEERIRKEEIIHGDLVQGDFIDDYRNLTYKGLLMLKWFVWFCPRASFIVKVDADVFVNVYHLDPLLRIEYARSKRFLACKVHWRSRVLRPNVWCGKWCVSVTDYHDTFYPPYCWGTFYIMSRDMAAEVLSTSDTVPIWWVDDVYLTGIIPRTFGWIQHVVFSEYLEENPARLQTVTDNHIVFALIQSLNDSLNAWNSVKNSRWSTQDTWSYMQLYCSKCCLWMCAWRTLMWLKRSKEQVSGSMARQILPFFKEFLFK